MDDQALAQLMLEYRKVLNQAEILAGVIQTEVIARRGTVKLPGVLKAGYFKPSNEVDYEAAARAANCTEAQIEAHTTPNPSTRWKEVAAEVKADLTSFTRPKPARVKLTELVQPEAALEHSTQLIFEMEDACT
jgi:predicted metal-dependent phosphotriesterase family hydrolase